MAERIIENIQHTAPERLLTRGLINSLRRQGLVVQGNFSDVKEIYISRIDSLPSKKMQVIPRVMTLNRGTLNQEVITVFQPRQSFIRNGY